MSIDEMIALYDRQAIEFRQKSAEASRQADELRKARLNAKTQQGIATRSDVEAVEGTDTCGYRW